MIIMRKAAMPIPYVIALIIGVVVVAVLAYWFISSGGKGTSVGKEAECAARKVEFCTTQTTENWGKQGEVCGDKKLTSGASGNCKNFCQTIIPGWNPIQGSSCS